MPPTVGIPDKTWFAIYGPLEIGVLFSVFGFGLLLMQAFVYFETYPKGGWKMKWIIILVVAICFGQTISDCSRILKLTTVHPADIIFFLKASERPEEVISPILSVVVSTITQLFLWRRCLMFTGVTENPNNRSTALYRLRIWGLAGFGLAGILLSFGTGLGVPIRLWMLENLATANGDRSLKLLTTMWLGTSSAIDILLSGYIIYKLRGATKHSEDRNKVVDALVRLSIQAGGLVTALQLAALITYLTATSTWADFPAIFISKVYAITLISSISRPRRQASASRLHSTLPHPIPHPHPRDHRVRCLSSPTIVGHSVVTNGAYQQPEQEYSSASLCGCQNNNDNGNGAVSYGVDQNGFPFNSNQGIYEKEMENSGSSGSDMRGRSRDGTLVMSASGSGLGTPLTSRDPVFEGKRLSEV
ncbi:uncharacterized protein I303_108338 [Kwoniella dejecticola CBS 10117]|uniref:DUF6534 domain-containing protein n=1 Tax=Kwoniella dejecticola CBS 10117 TaxID=1296121 RepID=A0A1A5ZXP0_9TREE|nr:uncharacterized protein I303_07335 [Kwoniella dejecticola CBS 10117]OBR82574.1 hypothetical protein I303_07335 [Kwoniella dejecticola CBS 10117]